MRNILFTITTPVVHRGKEYDKEVMEIDIEDGKMYARTLGNNHVTARIDITVIWNFFKQTQEYLQSPEYVEHKKHQLTK